MRSSRVLMVGVLAPALMAGALQVEARQALDEPVTDVLAPSEDDPPAQNRKKHPAARRWAVIIGINEYAGSTPNAIGSRQDARALYKLLLKKGWRKKNIRLLLDRDATAKAIVNSVKWLARKTDERSIAIFHYAGHEMPFYNGGVRHVSLWATDNRFVMDRRLGKLMNEVKHKRMWIHFATCRAGGFDDPGIPKKGRVITYSSPEEQLSYEDPEVGHSVFGYYTIIEGLKKKWADRNGNGKVSVQAAFRYAKGRVAKRTGGRQTPLMDDRLGSKFLLRVPKPKRAEPEPAPEPEQTCVLGICA